MSDSECKAGPYPEETGQVRNDACDGFSTLDLSDVIRRRVKAHQRVEKDGDDIRERAEKDARVIAKAVADNERDEQLKELKWAIRQQDEEKLMRTIENIVRRVLIEERVATKITIFK